MQHIGLDDPALTNSLTLCLGAAVYQSMWDHHGQLEDLRQAGQLYQAAWERNPQDPDSCHGADNAAYVFDRLAYRLDASSRSGDGNTARAERYRQQATLLRQAALAEMAQRRSQYPCLIEASSERMVTLANLQLGLGMIDAASLQQACISYRAAVALFASAGPANGAQADWGMQAIFQRALALVRFHHYLPPEFDQSQDGGNDGDDADDHAVSRDWTEVEPVFQAILGQHTAAAYGNHRGKVGLALSGGGFRAAFYHLGAMARMAEVDALRGIEVMSTVSGGSVVGVHYYLEVQQLLESRDDDQLSRDDYIALMQRVQENFLAGVQTNIGGQITADLKANFQMLLGKTNTSYRIGELYEKELYSRVRDVAGAPHEKARSMPELLIKPLGKTDFSPRQHNWRRAAKVPVLLINTTSLNTGHNWHFTASWMGEPPGLLRGDVDATERYRRLYYHQAPSAHLRQFRLGHAVAASSCVPGIFEAVPINGLYQDRVVRLMDGGVHDNQGMAGLLDEGCTRILCSDASGQMAEQYLPPHSGMGVPMRATTILQSRIRGVQYLDARVRADNHALQGLFFIHLKQGLESEPIDWIGCEQPAQKPPGSDTSSTTPYGIDKEMQKLLAGIRTDLDSFTEVEANALMLSGYLTTEYEFKQLQAQHEKQGLPGTWGGYQIDAERGDWPFLQLAPIMARPATANDPQRQDLALQLEVSANQYFKIWHLNKPLSQITMLLGGIALLCIAYLLWHHRNTVIAAPLGHLTWGVATLIVFAPILLLLFSPIKLMLIPNSPPRGVLHKTVLALLAWGFGQIHLRVFDKMYLRRGEMQRLLALKK